MTRRREEKYKDEMRESGGGGRVRTDAYELDIRLRVLNRKFGALVLDHLLPVRTHPGSPRSRVPSSIDIVPVLQGVALKMKPEEPNEIL